MLLRLALVLFAALASAQASAAELRVAVASNFAATAKQLVKVYQQRSKDRITLLVGSTGKHASQIQHGLHVDIFLAADVARPEWLEQKGLVVADSRFTYALGQLALWSSDSELLGDGAAVLVDNKFKRLAIANPKTAPYGKAALEAIEEMSSIKAVQAKLVRGESVAQAYQFTSSANAELGFIALSQALAIKDGSYWPVPNTLHAPIEQQAALLVDSDAARAFLAFMVSEPALQIIERAGYLRP